MSDIKAWPLSTKQQKQGLLVPSNKSSAQNDDVLRFLEKRYSRSITYCIINYKVRHGGKRMWHDMLFGSSKPIREVVACSLHMIRWQKEVFESKKL